MLHIPYGRGFLEIDAGNAPVLRSRVNELRSVSDGQEIVRAAMEHPIGSPRLSELARGKSSCVIIISDHTRPVPSRDILPNMLRELREGSPDIRVTLLVATGFHRATTAQELEEKLGAELLAQCRVVVHDCADAESNVTVGVLPSGTPLVIDRLAAETELLIAEGFIEPHFFAGFSGGRKSVLPGVCDRTTVLGNHRGEFIGSPFARTGILDGNPINADMEAAAKLVGLQFIVNVIIDEHKKTVAAFAGDCIKAHRRGCEYLRAFCEVAASPADIVLTSNGGYPLDQNFYQCVKGMTAAEACLNENGVIIMCAECSSGHGGYGFYSSLRNCTSPAELYARQLATPWDRTEPDQWESQILCRILSKYRTIFVTQPGLRSMVEDMKMTYAADIPSALALARSWGKQSLTVIPDGVSISIVNSRDRQQSR